MARAVDDLYVEGAVDNAVQRLRTLLGHAPTLLLTVFPTLIQRLRWGGRDGAAIRALLDRKSVV